MRKILTIILVLGFSGVGMAWAQYYPVVLEQFQYGTQSSQSNIYNMGFYGPSAQVGAQAYGNLAIIGEYQVSGAPVSHGRVYQYDSGMQSSELNLSNSQTSTSFSGMSLAVGNAAYGHINPSSTK